MKILTTAVILHTLPDGTQYENRVSFIRSRRVTMAGATRIIQRDADSMGEGEIDAQCIRVEYAQFVN